MFRWLPRRRYSPIGIDLGARSIKLVQLTGDRCQLVDAARVELPPLDFGLVPLPGVPQQYRGAA